jgi:signal transduction histidine kinase/CheY-like chemotaxis protein
VLNPLHNLRTVRSKLVWIVAVISGIVVLAVSIAAAVRGYVHLKEQTVAAVTSQSLIVAVNSSAAMAFDDAEMAQAALSALRVVGEIERATLVDNDGRVFAAFPTVRDAGPVARLYPVGHWRDPDGEGYVLVVPVDDQAGVHGRLQVRYTGAALAREAWALALQSGVLTLLAIGLAWLLAWRLHPILTTPVLELERTARRVRDTGDYAVRAPRISNDELGDLTDAFNEMLGRIETSQRALIEAQQRAEESSRLKDEFVATVSHELRTPLSPILAWIQILRLRRDAAAELPNALDVMERNARSLIHIIDDLLDMSRIVSGTLRLDVQPVDIDTIIGSAVETLAPAADSRQVRIVLELATPAPPLRGDASRLQQVVWNLLSNAVKFSPSGGCVSVATVHRGMRVDVIVRDEGSGIEPAFLPYVFDRFRQQDGSITRKHGGLGLGLAIVRQVVELHGGTVRAESRGPGTGATFIASLPIVEAALHIAVPNATPEPAPPSRLDGTVVLLVEDQPDMRAIIREALEDAGATVNAAGDAHQALVLFKTAAPDVLVSDIGLPDLDGYELLRQIRRDLDPDATVPAIALTAYVRPEERNRALAAGYRFHLSKPVEPAALVSTVAAAAGAGPTLERTAPAARSSRTAPQDP